MEKREVAKRVRRRIEVRYGAVEPEFTGYSANISRTGIMVRAVRVFARGTVLNLELKLDEKTFRLRGKVSWAREGTVQLLSTGRVGMGIEFLDPPEDLLAWLPAKGY